MTQQTLVLGGGPVGHALATQLQAHDRSIALVDDDAATIRRATAAGIDAYESALDSAKLSVDLTARTVVVATASDARNLLLGGAAPAAFRAERIVALLNEPQNQPAFDDAGIETVRVPETLARATSVRFVEEPNRTSEENAEKERLRE